MPRKYEKKSEYWNQPRKAAPTPIVVNTAPAAGPAIQPQPMPDVNYGSVEIQTTHNREALAASAPATAYRGSQTNNGLADPAAFQNLRALPSTFVGYTGDRSYAGMQEPIQLVNKAWTGVPSVRNAIEVAVEFSSQPLYFKSDNATVQKFFTEWWKAIQGPKLVRQCMRCYYREGNDFIYTFYGKFGPAYYKNIQQSFSAKENRIPIRYELLNPTNVFVPTGLTFPYTYVRLLSTYELDRLKNPVTVQDKQVYNDLPQMAKDQMRMGSQSPLGVYIPMDPKRLRYFFYKKQDYEPLAVPMVWPVLPYIEWDLALMKMDMELARKIEHAILLVTTGEAPSQFNGGNGINQNNIARLQALFNNQTLTRYLVADYTVEAKWLIPDVKEILGSEKYRVVTERIKEGLQSILTGDDKFANAQIKAKIFIQRLEEGQNCFLDDFLMPEVESICETMGFRDIPQVGFQKIDLQDEAIMARIITQLGQIGVLTAEQVVKAIDTGILPDSSEMQRGQEAYKAARDKGLYEPLIGGQKDDGTGPNGRPGGSGGGKQSGTRKSSPIGTSRAAISMRTYTEHLKAAQQLESDIHAMLQKRFGIAELDEAQRAVAQSMVERIVTLEPVASWRKAIKRTFEKPPIVPAALAAELEQIELEYNVDALDAALLRHCRTAAPEESV